MITFTKVCNDIATDHYITKVKDGFIYYGQFIPGHENKKATGCMSVDSYNKKCRKPQQGWIYTSGCTHGPRIPCTVHIIGQEIKNNPPQPRQQTGRL